jgi:hypothetical protein
MLFLLGNLGKGSLDKEFVRKEALRRRKALSAAARSRRSSLILNAILSLKEF